MQTHHSQSELDRLTQLLQNQMENIRQRQIRKYTSKANSVSEDLLDTVSRQVAERLLALSLKKIQDEQDPQALLRYAEGLSVLTRSLA